MTFTHVLIDSAEKPKRSKTIGSSYVTLLTTYLAKKTNKKQCSKFATETLGKDVY